MRFTSLAALALTALLAPAAAQDFDSVLVETSDYDGDQPASMPLWQTVIVDWEGDVEVRHFSPFHSSRFRGTATAKELAALEQAVRTAKLGVDVPPTFSAAPWGDTFKVEGGLSSLRGETKGEVERAGALEPRLEPLRAIALRIAERLVQAQNRRAAAAEPAAPRAMEGHG